MCRQATLISGRICSDNTVRKTLRKCKVYCHFRQIYCRYACKVVDCDGPKDIYTIWIDNEGSAGTYKLSEEKESPYAIF